MMYCKSKKSNRYLIGLVIVGAISLVFGIIGHKVSLASTGNEDMLLGMFSGLGATFVATGTIRLFRNKFTSKEKLKQEEIDLKDERNVQILRAAYTITNVASSILFALLAFVFVWLNYRTPAFIAIGALWIQVIVFFISYCYFSKKM